VHNETLSAVAMCVSDPGYRISVGAGVDRGLLKPSAKPRSVCWFGFWVFPYSIHSRLSQPFSSLLSQFRGSMRPEFVLHPHLMRLNRFDAYIQFTCQFRNADASANKRENLQLPITETIDVRGVLK
jgi:hypothetical protein